MTAVGSQTFYIPQTATFPEKIFRGTDFWEEASRVWPLQMQVKKIFILYILIICAFHFLLYDNNLPLLNLYLECALGLLMWQASSIGYFAKNAFKNCWIQFRNCLIPSAKIYLYKYQIEQKNRSVILPYAFRSFPVPPFQPRYSLKAFTRMHRGEIIFQLVSSSLETQAMLCYHGKDSNEIHSTNQQFQTFKAKTHHAMYTQLRAILVAFVFHW